MCKFDPMKYVRIEAPYLLYAQGQQGADIRRVQKGVNAYLRQSCHTDGCTHVVGEDEEGGAVGDKALVVEGNAVADSSHGVLAHTEAEVLLL